MIINNAIKKVSNEVFAQKNLCNQVRMYAVKCAVKCESAQTASKLLFGRVKRVSRERASKGPRKGPSLARSSKARFACPNRRACSCLCLQAS